MSKFYGPEVVAEVLTLSKGGLSNNKIAKQLGICLYTINQMVKEGEARLVRTKVRRKAQNQQQIDMEMMTRPFVRCRGCGCLAQLNGSMCSGCNQIQDEMIRRTVAKCQTTLTNDLGN